MSLIRRPREKGNNGGTMMRGKTEKKNKRNNLFWSMQGIFNSDITHVFS
jgi:hypothetical protein